MNTSLNTSTRKTRVEIDFFITIIFLFLFRSSFPLFKYPFILLFICFFLYAVLSYKRRLIDCFKEYLTTYYLILILTLLFSIALFSSSKLFLYIFKDAINIIVLLLIFFILTLIIYSKERLQSFISRFIFVLLIISTFIALINTYVFIEIQKNFGYYPIHNYQNKFIINSLLLDKNFAILPVLYGFVVLLHKLNNNLSKVEKVFYNLLLLFFSFHILISLSRRGQIILFLIIAFTLALRFLFFIKKNIVFKRLVANLAIFHSSLIVLSLFFILFFHFGSYDFKVNTLKFFKVKDISGTKAVFTSIIFSYAHRFNNNLSYDNFNKKLWSTSFYPKDPDNGWGVGIYKTTYPLVGKNVEIVPEGSIGYHLDSLCSFSNSESHAYSNTMIFNQIVNNNDTIKASVFCYASDDFNGDMICLRADGEAYGDRVSTYKLDSKGIWQKLSINASCNHGDASVSLYFNKQGVTNFSKLMGFVIFAYPDYKICSYDSIVSTHSKSEDNLEKLLNENIDSKYSNLLMTNAFVVSERLNKASLFNLSLAMLSSKVDTLTESDPFRKWVAKFISEDTTYYPYKANLEINIHSARLADERISRWKFAIQIFTKEYNWKERILGKGFDFLNWYGSYFYQDKTKSDYPHNPLLHILLYSGFLGLLLYLYLMYKVACYYLKYIKEFYLIFIFFLITYFFSFFSSGTPFDPPLMGFFIILPFFIHAIYMKNKHNQQ